MRPASQQRIIVNVNQCFSLLRFRSELIRTLIDEGHDVLITLPEVPPEHEAALSRLGARHVIVPLARSSLDPLRDLAYLGALRRIHLSYRPDISFSIMIKPAIYGSLAARATGTGRTVVMLTGLGYAFEPPRSRKQRLAALAARLLLKRALVGADVAILHNADDRSLLVSLGIIDFARTREVDGSGVDLDVFTPSPLPEAQSFLLIARLLKAKGVVEYIEAARRVRSMYPDARFRLLGPRDGSPDSIEFSIVERAVAAGAIEYLGATSDVRPAIRDARVVVLPSYREGRPRSLLEAMAMARPIITTDVPGCRDLVLDNVNGLKVAAKSVAELAAAMGAFCRDPQLAVRMAPNSLEMATTRYSVHVVNRRMIGLLLGREPHDGEQDL